MQFNLHAFCDFSLHSLEKSNEQLQSLWEEPFRWELSYDIRKNQILAKNCKCISLNIEGDHPVCRLFFRFPGKLFLKN